VRVLIPGIATIIGKLVAARLTALGHSVVGIDARPVSDAPDNVTVHIIDIRKRAAEDLFRKFRPEAVIHMGTVTQLIMDTEARYRINLGSTRAVFAHCKTYHVQQCIFVGRHTYYGAEADSPLYHTEDEPPMGLSHFPELADLVAADLYAATALWRQPDLTTTVLRSCYTLGPSGSGTLARFLISPRVPMIMGFDPLFQFMHEEDVADAIVVALEKRLRGVYNVTGPQPVPLSVVIRQAGRSVVPLPEFLVTKALGKFGLPKLPIGALNHIKYPVVADGGSFRLATGFAHRHDEEQTILDFRAAFPPRADQPDQPPRLKARS